MCSRDALRKLSHSCDWLWTSDVRLRNESFTSSERTRDQSRFLCDEFFHQVKQVTRLLAVMTAEVVTWELLIFIVFCTKQSESVREKRKIEFAITATRCVWTCVCNKAGDWAPFIDINLPCAICTWNRIASKRHWPASFFWNYFWGRQKGYQGKQRGLCLG